MVGQRGACGRHSGLVQLGGGVAVPVRWRRDVTPEVASRLRRHSKLEPV